MNHTDSTNSNAVFATNVSIKNTIKLYSKLKRHRTRKDNETAFRKLNGHIKKKVKSLQYSWMLKFILLAISRFNESSAPRCLYEISAFLTLFV